MTSIGQATESLELGGAPKFAWLQAPLLAPSSLCIPRGMSSSSETAHPLLCTSVAVVGGEKSPRSDCCLPGGPAALTLSVCVISVEQCVAALLRAHSGGSGKAASCSEQLQCLHAISSGFN